MSEFPVATRKVVQTTATSETLYALCDDGTIWGIFSLEKGWKPVPPIPQGEVPRG